MTWSAIVPLDLLFIVAMCRPQQSKFDVKLLKFKDGAKFTVLKEIRRLKPGMSLMDVSNAVVAATSI